MQPWTHARRLLLATTALALASLTGCATLTGKSHQQLQLEVLDAADRPVAGMSCRITNASGKDDPTKRGMLDFDVTVTSPASGVEVRRSSQPMHIDCRKGQAVATAVVQPRRDGLEQALVPFGSVAVFIDHVTGGLYAYPTQLSLRLGQHVLLEHGEQSKVMKAEAILGAVQLASTPVPAVLSPGASAAAPPATASAAPDGSKPRAGGKTAGKPNAVAPPANNKKSNPPGATAVSPVAVKAPASASPVVPVIASPVATSKVAMTTLASASPAGASTAQKAAPLNW